MIAAAALATTVAACGSKSHASGTTPNRDHSVIYACGDRGACALARVSAADVRRAGAKISVRCQGENHASTFRVSGPARINAREMASSSASVAFLRRALRACPRYPRDEVGVAHSPSRPGWAQPQRRRTLVMRFVRCIRAHGVPDMPYPPTNESNLAAFAHAARMAATSPAFRTTAAECGRAVRAPG